ncbi:MAG TPA: hypothetical protein VHE55_05265 [Fimbriimonadaceae bacterium]|nr:hypothetical protein [Fimbriimonadaceae bacterium]
MKALATDFEPDLVVVECFTTFWWQGAAEAIRCARAVWPNCEIAVVGGYAEFAQEHAGKHSGADFIQPKPPLAETPTTNLTFYPAGGPKTAQLRVGGHELEAVLDAVTACRKSGAEEFSLEIRNLGKEKAALARLREECARRKITIPFDILGCVQAEDFIRNSDCISDLRALGMRHVVFADDRSGSLCSSEAFVGSCIEAAELFYAAGYKRRTDTVTASLCIGRPGEDLRDRIEAVTLLNHHIGSTILWPYQPLPSELPDQSLELQNGKLFPMREQNGLAYKDYAELVALNAVLNSRYRDCSFDFLGESLTARLLSESVSREAWNADESVKGSTVLPMRAGQ